MDRLKEKAPPINSDTLYNPLIDEESAKPNKEPSGIKAVKDFCLKNAETYDKELKEKIFFIGQNAIQGNDKLMPNE